MSPNFLSVSNSFDVMRQVSINAVIAFGMTLSILLGGIDLSVGSILARLLGARRHDDEARPGCRGRGRGGDPGRRARWVR